ncbi:SGNH/GDSL hydrolase family protein [Trueperella abortisuis]|uniref:Lysophospholipase L1-like esterase n=1 Tax=Trueperella abortisuis TaxID=445930 RepID=A0ABT9PII7_9ACTO|nr:GDSL-type esterase/lipase family protein [Trueperella abortisuis]MDP9832528.1 lysophospholipase L1-like esterase [Trueperella abortisuis]
MAVSIGERTVHALKASTFAGLAALGVTAGMVRRRGVARQNSPFRRYWERHLQAQLADLAGRVAAGEEMPLIYVALGDSAAQGLGATRVQEGYVPRLAVALEAMSGREVALVNLSLSGGTIQSVLGTQLPQLRGLRVAGEPLRPDVVTLDIGGNDVLQPWLSKEDFDAYVERAGCELPEGTFVMNIPSFAVMAKADARAEAFSGSIERLAGTHHMVDIRSLSQSLPLPTYMFSYHAIDLFHPNTPWYAVWAQSFADAVADARGWRRTDVASLPAWSGPIAAP